MRSSWRTGPVVSLQAVVITTEQSYQEQRSRPPWRQPLTPTVGLGAETHLTGRTETTSLEVTSSFQPKIPTRVEKPATSSLYYVTPW